MAALIARWIQKLLSFLAFETLLIKVTVCDTTGDVDGGQ